MTFQNYLDQLYTRFGKNEDIPELGALSFYEEDNTSDYLMEGLLHSLIHSSKIAVKNPKDYGLDGSYAWSGSGSPHRCHTRHDVGSSVTGILPPYLSVRTGEIQKICHKCMGCKSRRKKSGLP